MRKPSRLGPFSIASRPVLGALMSLIVNEGGYTGKLENVQDHIPR